MGDKDVSEIGKRLSQRARPNKDFLVKSLRQAAKALSELEQNPMLESAIKPLSDYILKNAMLQHKDRDVRLLLGICFTEIIRILAPEPPFSDSHFRGIFTIIISVFSELADNTSAYFSRAVKILETVAKLKCCIIMLDIGCQDLVLDMINTFFSVVSKHHQQSLVDAIVSIMALILEEEVSQPFLDVILLNLLEKGESAPASRLSASVIQACSENLVPPVCAFLTSCILDRDAVQSKLKERYHEIIYKVYPCAPQMLLGVIPTLTQELLADQVDIRKKSVDLIGKLFALPGHHIAQEYHRLFVEFLKRFSDKSAEVRVSALQCAKACYMANPSQAESKELLSALYGRLVDFDDSVRTQAVIVACDIARSNLKYVPNTLIDEVSKRLRDKKITVRKKAFQKLLEVYRDYCTKCSEGYMTVTDDFEKIPCKIFMLCYDKNCKEFRPQNLELVLADDLFPVDLSVEEKTRHWIHLFSLFDPLHVKALKLILCQKQRFQTEFQSYMALRRKEKESCSEEEELKRRTKGSFVKMSATFVDPTKAEECFYKLDLMKDNSIFNSFTEMLTEVTIVKNHVIRDKLLKMIGDKHPLLEFLRSLLDKCMFNIFSSEHVSCILDLLSNNSNETKSLEASLDLLSTIISYFPILLEDSKEKFQMLISEEHRPFNEKLIQVLGKAGTHVSIKSCDIYPTLKRICIEGTRTQSKSAVSAIAALNSPPKLFSDLCETLVDSLHKGENLPTILKSLGCVAQHSVSTIEPWERKIAEYIMDRIFSVEPSIEPAALVETSDPCDTCKLKIYGLKTLVKMLLQREGSKSTYQLDELLELFQVMLRAAGTKHYTFSCLGESDNEYIRLAAAKAVLKISRRWDLHVSPQIFRLTVLMAKDRSLSVSRSFMDKTHKLLKGCVIPKRYACAFALAAPNYPTELKTDPYIYMAEFIKEYGRGSRLCQSSAVEGGPITDHPAYVVVYLIHILAHDPGFPSENCIDEKLYATFCSPLFFIILASVSAMDRDKDLSLSYFLSIFRAIRKAEDAVDIQRKSKLQILADIGISIVNALTHRGISSSYSHSQILLPASLYKGSIAKKYEASSGSPSPFNFDEIFVNKIIDHYICNISQFISSVPNNSKITQEGKTWSDNLRCSIMNLASGMQVDLSTGRVKEDRNSYLHGKDAPTSSRKEPITRGGRKQGAPAYPGTIELHNDHCRVNGLTGDPEKLSSCDSVTLKHSKSKSGVSNQGIDVSNSDTIIESVMARNAVNSEVLAEQKIILSSPIDKRYTGTDNGFDSKNIYNKFSCDSREQVGLLSTSNDTCTNTGESALPKKECVAAGKQNALHPQQRMSSCIKACCSDRGEYSTLSSLKETIDSTNIENENLTKRLVPLNANKKKKRTVSVDTSTSEIADQNENPVSRRTRSRKL